MRLRARIASLSAIFIASPMMFATGSAFSATTAVASAAIVPPAWASSVPAHALSASSVPSSLLRRLFVKGAGVAAGGVTTGSIRVAVTPNTGVRWAVASFEPAASLGESGRVRFQDGGGTGIFEKQPGQAWTFVETGVAPLGCDAALPASVRTAWNITAGVGCSFASPSVVDKAEATTKAEATANQSLGAKIAAIALSQVKEQDIPATTNFGLDCDPYTTMVGPWYPNPDNRGCGFNSTFNVSNESEEWCADFAEWVWQQAGVTTDMDLINPGANSFYNWGVTQGTASAVDSTDYQVGDAIVFYEPGPITTSTGADHVGIVTGVNPDGTVNLVDGDFLGSTNIGVQYNADVNVPTWSSEVWSPGEQWVLIPPPVKPQPPAPTVLSINGPLFHPLMKRDTCGLLLVG